MKKHLAMCLLFALILSLSGCSPKNERYVASYWDAFDTQLTIMGYAKSKAEFDAASEAAHQEFLRLHKIFDSHTEQPGAGVWAVNHAAGQPLQVEPELIEVLELSRDMAEKTTGKFSPALGAVTEIWSRYRSEGVRLPGMEELMAASVHTDISDIRLDAGGRTVQLLDPLMRLDLGAVAKGYAVERLAKLLSGMMPSFLIDAGGNIRAGEAPADGREAWTVGVTDPAAALLGESSKVLGKFQAVNVSVVSSGGYQRYYEVDGVKYHHIIDPETLMPGDKFLQVTVLARDSGLADCLSTALFLMDYDVGRALIESLPGVDAIWVRNDATVLMTPGAALMAVGGE